jgi:hypothetical protein
MTSTHPKREPLLLALSLLTLVTGLVDAACYLGLGPVGLVVPAQGEADHVPRAMGRLSGGLWRQGVAVIWMVGRPGASSRVVAHGWRPRALPPSRPAPVVVVVVVVVRTAPAAGSRARPALSRLSPWWS